jgi:hypothetical protein
VVEALQRQTSQLGRAGPSFTARSTAALRPTSSLKRSAAPAAAAAAQSDPFPQGPPLGSPAAGSSSFRLAGPGGVESDSDDDESSTSEAPIQGAGLPQGGMGAPAANAFDRVGSRRTSAANMFVQMSGQMASRRFSAAGGVMGQLKASSSRRQSGASLLEMDWTHGSRRNRNPWEDEEEQQGGQSRAGGYHSVRRPACRLSP